MEIINSTLKSFLNPIIDYLAKEVFLNKILKYPLNAAPQGIHISPVGVILKKQIRQIQ